MMYPRLNLLRELMADDAAIIVSIDNNEISFLRLMMDEIFGPSCFVAELIWKSRQHLDSRSKNGISLDHEYLLVYEKRRGGVAFRGRERDITKYKNPDNDPRGPWMSRSILGLATAVQRPNLHYDLVDPKTGRVYPCAPATGWRYSKETMNNLIDDGRILFPKNSTGRPREKVFQNYLQKSHTGFPSIIDGIFTDEGTYAIREILGSQIFSFPKPPGLVATLVEQVATEKDSLVLDSFAGSGTTGHAVMQLNKQDGGNRRFILVEMNPNICINVTAERLKRVCSGYTKPNGEQVEGLGGGFRYCQLGEPLFAADGSIRKEVSFSDLARHVFFTETGESLPSDVRGRSPLIGLSNGTAVYLLYNGILGDRALKGGNVLTNEVLSMLPANKGLRVVYGTACRLSPNRLKKEGIVFRQIPYEIRIS
jgi:adenine-specific DNA-methyltransferase